MNAAASTTPRLVLASASPRRVELLSQLGVDFETVPAEVEENEATDADPHDLVLHNAALKADWVATRRPEAFVLGADTAVFLDGTVLHKPADPVDARRMLRMLSGRTHSVFTGLAVRCRQRGIAEDAGVESRVVFRDLGADTIEEYIAKTAPFDKAGSYGIQDEGAMIIERWEGSFSNIVGLPIEVTKEILTRHGLLPT